MKRKYFDIVNIENDRLTFLAFLSTKFQGLGFIISTDPSITRRQVLLIEFNLLWFRLWISFYTEKAK